MTSTADLVGADHDVRDEDLDIQRTVRKFAADRLRPHIADWYAAGVFPAELAQEFGGLGLLGAVRLERLRLRHLCAGRLRGAVGDPLRADVHPPGFELRILHRRSHRVRGGRAALHPVRQRLALPRWMYAGRRHGSVPGGVRVHRGGFGSPLHSDRRRLSVAPSPRSSCPCSRTSRRKVDR